MNNQTRAHFKNLLSQNKVQLEELEQRATESTQTVDLDQSSVGRLSRMDAMQSQAMAIENKRRREIQLTRVNAALERIKEGEYGYCSQCEEEINIRRLEADPANPFCVSCAEKM